MSYCYGLSVIHSHLLVGAGLILTDHSVVDDEFWELFRRHRGTAFAGVPYTFELLERVGFDADDLPDLRYVTQAGGRMPPERVRRFAELAQRSGFELFVMYGATEATARMSYLPPELALSRPRYDRPSDPRRIVHDRAAGRLGRRRRRRAGLPRPQRDDGLRARARRPGAGQDRRDAAHRRHRPARPRRPLRGRRPQQPVRQDVRPAHRSRSRSRPRCAPRACRRSAPTTTTVIAGRRRRQARRARRPTGGGRGGGCTRRRRACRRRRRTAAAAVGQARLSRRVRRLARATDQPPSTDLRELFADVLQVDAGDHRSRCQLRRPRRQFAVVRDDDGAVGTGDRPAAPGLAANVDSAAGRASRSRARRSWLATLETSVALRAAAIVLIVGSHAGLFELWGGAHFCLASPATTSAGSA